MKKIVIIGAGAAGVYLSILLKQRLQESLEIIVIEQNHAPLKKLLATGNGRCNLSNKDLKIDYYQSNNQDIVKDIIDSFDMKQAMNELGLLTMYQGNLLYPRSEQALTVKNILMNTAEKLGVLFFYEQEVTRITYTKQYLVETNQQTYKADHVIFAMGSEAGKLSGIKKTRYEILKKLHLDVIEPTPSLVQMNTQPILKQLKGVRVKGTFRLLENNQCVHEEKGELLFTDYGVSGIAVMQLSAYYQKGHHYEISLDLFDEETSSKLYDFLELRKQQGYNHFYDGMVNSKIATYFESLHLESTSKIVKQLKDMRLKVVDLKGYETAQVMKGGLSLQEVDQQLKIKKYPHMYAIGEILNVTGMCGGYNLHFAFASAKRVADAIEREYYVENS